MPTVLVPLAQGCEELEAVTLIDILRRAGIEVVSAGLDDKPVIASRGVVLLPDATLDSVMERGFDMIVLPGGLPGTQHLNQDQRIHALLRKLHAAGKYLAAICAAPQVLADAGILNGKQATSYPGVLDTHATAYQWVSTPVVRDGAVITSRGPGTAMDFALELVEILTDRATRARVEAGLVRA